jgi:hypothetical protein
MVLSIPENVNTVMRNKNRVLNHKLLAQTKTQIIEKLGFYKKYWGCRIIDTISENCCC